MTRSSQEREDKAELYARRVFWYFRLQVFSPPYILSIVTPFFFFFSPMARRVSSVRSIFFFFLPCVTQPPLLYVLLIPVPRSTVCGPRQTFVLHLFLFFLSYRYPQSVLPSKKNVLRIVLLESRIRIFPLDELPSGGPGHRRCL